MVNYGFSNIPSLVSAWDVGNPKCYSGSGANWYDLCNTSLMNSPGNPYWSNNISSITISIVLEKIAYTNGYSINQITKINNGWANNASFSMYHFGDYLGNGADGVIQWYANISQDLNSGWTPITTAYTRMVSGNKYHIVLQYSSLTGGKLWVNGTKIGSPQAGGMLGQTLLPSNSVTTNIVLGGPLPNGIDRSHHIQFYNRELDDNEIYFLYKMHKQRFGLA